MLSLLNDFVGELRAAGIPVSMSEHVDAARAMEVVDLADRSLVRDSLAATLVKDGGHLPAFYNAFEIFFALRGLDDVEQPDDDEVGADGAPRRSGEPGPRGLSTQELMEMIVAALREGDAGALRRAAREAVTRFAGMEPGRPVGGTYYLYRTLRSLDLAAIEDQLIDLPDGSIEGDLADRLARDEAKSRVEALKKEIERVIRERLVADRGAEALARSVRKPLPEDLDVMHANREEMAQLERALRPLSRKLAVRLARKRRRRHRGPVDLRHTVRRSLSTGGVPMDLRFKPPRPAKPEIVVIADVSGSVASFARFTLMLVHAISSQFSKVRSFVFIDGLDEITSLFEGVDDPADAVAKINATADVVAFDGHSDYGRALLTFHEQFADQLTRRSTILVLGDARNNYHQAHPEVLADLRYRAKALYWLNPEPQAYWNSGDSIVSQYAPYCDRVIECRTLRQLEAFVGQLS